MNELSLLYNFLLVGAILFALGLVGFVVRRNMIVMFLCAEMMLQGILSIQAGDNPRITQDKMLAFVPSTTRVKLRAAA